MVGDPSLCEAVELVAAGLDDEARRDPDAIEAVYRKLNAADEARQQGAFSAARQPSLNRADDMLSLPRVAQSGATPQQPPGRESTARPRRLTAS